MSIYKVNDCYQVMNSLARQATAQADITVTDHQSFVDAGNKVLASLEDNVFGSLAKTIAEFIISSRKYNGKFGLISSTSNQFNTRKAKISFYSSDNEASGAFNTNLYDNIKDGNVENSGAGSMWEQKLSKVVERFFLSEAAFDKHYTYPLVQIQAAFNDEATFIRFMNAMVTEIENDIASTIESRNRALVADRIAGTYLMHKNGKLGDECVVNMVKYFNDSCGTNYSMDEILQKHLTEFCELWTAKIKIDSDRLEERTALYHDPLTITENGIDYNVLRFTGKDKQKMFVFSELFTTAKSRVFPEIFNPQYLNIDNGEQVTYWQSSKPEDRMKIKCKPSLPDGATSEVVELDNVISILFDTDAIQSVLQFEGAYQTPINAKKLFYNVFYHWKFGSISDYTENTIIYIMEDKNEVFEGDGTETDFVLEGTVEEILKVTVNGVAENGYTFDSDTNTISFTAAPEDDAVIKVYYK